MGRRFYKLYNSSYSRLWLVACVWTLVCTLSTVSFAAGEADIGEIRVEARTAREAADAPSSFATVIRPADENVTFENLSELLSASPGVTTRSLGGLGQYSTVSIRGSSPEQVSVYLDGVRMNTASGGAFDFSTIPIDSVERIEVIRGGGTAQFGGDAIGGVINIITKKAEGRSIEASAGGGSFTTIKLGASYSERFKKNSLTLSWTHMQSAGDFKFKTNPVRLSGSTTGLGGGETFVRINNGFLSEGFLSTWEHRFSEKYKLKILNDFFFTNREIPSIEEETTMLSPDNPVEAKERIIRNTNSVTFGINPFLTKELAFTLGVTNNFDLDHFKDPTPAISAAINKKTYNYSLGTYLKLMAVFDTKYVDQIITARYDYRLDYLTDSSPLSGSSLIGTKKRNTNSIYVQDEFSFLEDKLIFLPSVRYENATKFSHNLSYHGGIKISPTQWLQVKANVERAYRYPTFNELYFPDQGYIRGNPDLEKEKALNMDAGVGIHTKYASLEAAYFKNWIDNMIIFVPISATTIEPVNTYNVDMDGVELEFKFNPIKYVNGWFNYTYLNAHYAPNDNQLPGRPKHEYNAYLELNYDFNKHFGGSLFGRYNYKFNVPINTSNTVFLAARSKLDLGFNLRFAKYYYLIFEAKNVTNVQIYDSRGFPLPRRAFFGTFGGKWG